MPHWLEPILGEVRSLRCHVRRLRYRAATERAELTEASETENADWLARRCPANLVRIGNLSDQLRYINRRLRHFDVVINLLTLIIASGRVSELVFALIGLFQVVSRNEDVFENETESSSEDDV